MTSLPVIDLEPLHARRAHDESARVAREIDEACRSFGFFYAEGLGIADALLERLEAESRAFFALPAPDKAPISGQGCAL